MSADFANVSAHPGFGDARLPKRFWAHTLVASSGCWEWTGAKKKTGAKGAGPGAGYAAFQHGVGRLVGAHRHAYEALVGPIPDGLVIDHLCRNTVCVNPAHLEAVTPRENTLRGVGPSAINAHKTHCVNGHEFAGENLIVRSDGARRCRECGRRAAREYARRKRAAA